MAWQTGRARRSVPTTTSTTGASHDHGFPAPHQIPSATATPHTAGISRQTAAATHARPNPTPARATHAPDRFIS